MAFFKKQAPSAVPAVGHTLGGRYLVHKVFEGGLGVVCVVEDKSHSPDRGDSLFVLKFAKTQLPVDQQEAFRHEAAAWVAMGRHPSIVPAFWVDEVGSRLCVAAEYIPPDDMGRGSLLDHLNGSPKKIRQIFRWTSQFLDGLAHATSKGLITHADIKPANLLVDRFNDILITDFGLAKVRGTQNNVGGTPRYMSPEQWTGLQGTYKSDLYSFGFILHEMCFGFHPFAQSDFNQLRDNHIRNIPQLGDHPLSPLISWLWVKMPDKRPEVAEAKSLLNEIAQRHDIKLPHVIVSPQSALEELRAKATIEGPNGFRDALDAATEITYRWPDDASGWTQLGRLYLNIGDLRKAHAATAKSIVIDDTRSAPWNNLGVIWGALGEPERAISSFRRALECDPDNTGAMLNMAKPLSLLGRNAEAILVLRGAISLAPDKYAAWVNLAGCLKTTGDLREAIKALDRGYELAPHHIKGAILGQRAEWLGGGHSP